MTRHELVIEDLHASVRDKPILHGIDLVVRSGEVHAVMGPNGAGKSTLSHVLMGKAGYEVTRGSVRLDGIDLLALPTWRRAQAGLFLAMQYPTEVPGVALADMLVEALDSAGGADPARTATALRARLVTEAARIGFDARFVDRPLNVDLSGGEKKRNETLQLGVLKPKIAVLDEIDSGLDVDALRLVSRRIEAATNEDDLGVLAITHYSQLLQLLRPDHVHVLAKGRIQRSGGPELAAELERTGYAQWSEPDVVETPVAIAGFGEDPFADPFA
ncbi:MAG TPA: Fe-S cluster assembly ATPase SufC [Acidimicrobiales bacterium]|jgi:Fe-S cluster assembly ATP-binding protein|nr:Fe-S cluster assembly ATPase SufC [Acidimicrobiales bacterium]